MTHSLGYTLLVMGAPYSQQASFSALRFAQALVEKGHRLESVFFYHDGVYAASRLQTPPQDEPNVTRLWSDLAKQTRARLLVCVAAGLRRGILDQRESARHGIDADSIAEGFELAGLGQLVQSTAKSDRILTFA